MREIKRFVQEEDGMAVVEVVLILVVVVGLVVLFKGKIRSLLTKILGKISTKADTL